MSILKATQKQMVITTAENLIVTGIDCAENLDALLTKLNQMPESDLIVLMLESHQLKENMAQTEQFRNSN